MPEALHTQYTEATLCFPIRGDEVLLAEKQKKIGAGLLNGFGGKMEAGDRDIHATAVREVEEEVGIRVTDMKKVGEIVFRNPSDDAELRTMTVHIFIATAWEGKPTATDEMKRVAWYKISELDYSMFLSADRLFLPKVLGGTCVRGAIEYNNDWSVKTSQIAAVEDF